MMWELSRDKKRATIMFNRPGVGRTTVQEDAGRIDEGLRAAIEKAYAVFLAEWGKRDTANPAKESKDA